MLAGSTGPGISQQMSRQNYITLNTDSRKVLPLLAETNVQENDIYSGGAAINPSRFFQREGNVEYTSAHSCEWL